MKFEARSQEEIERQERCARGDAWRLAKNILKVLEQGYLLLIYQRMVSSGVVRNKTGEREFVVDSGANMHMVSRKDLNSAELESVRVSESPTTVVTANGEVLTKEEATVFVRELDLFVTVTLLEDTPAVLSFGKFFEDHGYNCHWTSGQKPDLTKDGRRIKCNTANYVPIFVPGVSTGSSCSAAPASPTSLALDAVVPTQHPASTRSESTSRIERVRGDPSREPEENQNKK